MKQIPQIYEANKTAIDGYALGSLPDALDCKVTEERNGEFYCELSYPAHGFNADLLKVGRILAVKPNMYGNTQGFRIQEIVKSLDGRMDITAYHVSYDLSNVIVMPFTAANITMARLGLKTNAKPTPSFNFKTDVTTAGTFTVTEPTPLRNLLVGQEGSMVDVYGGELLFDNWDVWLLSSRGKSRNVQIAYGKNLSGFKETDQIAKYDAVVPFAVYNETTYYITSTAVCATAPVVYANGTGSMYGFPKAIALDLSENYSDTAPTDAGLYADAQAYIRRNTTLPTANMSTEYADLAKILGNTERVELCDTVNITVTPYNVFNLTSKVISVTYDVLLDENSKVQVGDRKITLADTLAELTRGTT